MTADDDRPSSGDEKRDALHLSGTAADAVKEIFADACDRPPGERDAFLRSRCGDDADLRRAVDDLLKAHDEAGNFFAGPTRAARPDGEAVAAVGQRIGRYKLLQRIGEGGFGTVYMAEQEEPVRRRVALKIIKLGMDTKAVIARFEAERQALAMMDHPNIARVFDAGATDAGRPYFVMELVRGVPITDYCDTNNLPVRERLELFVQVCQAVQHAHQKGIIHRDIKPNNVMVAMADGRPTPKVIDFGIAKATDQRLTEKTLFTEFRQMIGTPQYMSPEQAEMAGIDIDTRSDVYSLGVLLYELLVGSTPFDPEELRGKAYGEMQRMIREVEPPLPSTRLSTLAGTLPSIAAHRRVEPKELGQIVKGELDWVVMRAMEKDRMRRYESASGLARDVLHYLANEPVLAARPSVVYRFRKFARRNRVAMFSGTLIAVSVLVAVVGITAGIGWAIRDRAARQEEAARQGAVRQAKVTGQLDLILDDVARLELAEKWPEALASAQRAEPALASDEAAPDVQKRARAVLADLELVGRIEDIRMMSGTVWHDGVETEAQTDRAYASTFRDVGIDVDALPVKDAANRIAAHHAITAALIPALDDWVAIRGYLKDNDATRHLVDLLRTADPDAWRQQMRDALARQDWPALQNLANSAELDLQPAATLSFLAAGLRGSGRQWDMETTVLRRAQWKYPADFWINHRLGVRLIWKFTPQGAWEGIGFMRAAVAIRPQNAHALMNLGNGYDFLMQYDDALACYRRALELKPHYATCYSNIGNVLYGLGRYDEALLALEQAVTLKPHDGVCDAGLSRLLSDCPEARLRQPQRAVQLAHDAVEWQGWEADSWRALGVAQYRVGAWHEARAALEKAAQMDPSSTSRPLDIEAGAVDDFFLAMTRWQLGHKDDARHRFAQAIGWMDKNSPDDRELRRLRAEAAELLKVTDQRPTTKPESK